MSTMLPGRLTPMRLAESELEPAELMAIDLIDLGWEPDAIEEAMCQRSGWVASAMEKAAAEAVREGIN